MLSSLIFFSTLRAEVILETISGKPAAFGDFNNDKLTDILFLSDDRRSFLIYLRSGDKFELASKTLTNVEIEYVIVTDFSFDGLDDVLAVFREGSDYRMEVFVQRPNFSFESQAKTEKTSVRPFILDYDFNFQPDFFLSPNVVLNLGRTQETVHFRDIKFHEKHLSSVADVDGDCIPDLILDVQEGTRKLLFFLGNKGYSKVETYSLEIPEDTRDFRFLDVDSDGSLDLVLQTDGGLFIYLNEQIPLCPDTFGKVRTDDINCRPAVKLCTSSAWSKFGFHDYYKVLHLDKSYFSFFQKQPKFRYADYNSDGFQDALMFEKNEILLLKNTEFSGTVLAECSLNKITTTEKRGFCIDRRIEMLNLKEVAFFDFNRNDRLGLLLFSNKLDYHDLSSEEEMLFLKTSVDSAACKTKTVSSYPGISFVVTSRNLVGKKFHLAGSLNTRSVGGSLELPFLHFGLGRTNNFIEEVFLSLAGHFKLWVSIIPNSHVTAIPCPTENSNSWILELAVSPSKYKIFVFLVTLVVLLLLLALLVILDIFERQKERRRRRNIFENLWL